jgi:hypothetical protein
LLVPDLPPTVDWTAHTVRCQFADNSKPCGKTVRACINHLFGYGRDRTSPVQTMKTQRRLGQSLTGGGGGGRREQPAQVLTTSFFLIGTPSPSCSRLRRLRASAFTASASTPSLQHVRRFWAMQWPSLRTINCSAPRARQSRNETSCRKSQGW